MSVGQLGCFELTLQHARCIETLESLIRTIRSFSSTVGPIEGTMRASRCDSAHEGSAGETLRGGVCRLGLEEA